MSGILAVEFGIPPGLHNQILEVKKAYGQSDRQAVSFMFTLGTRVERASFTPGQEFHIERKDTGWDTSLALFGDKHLFGNPAVDWLLNTLERKGLRFNLLDRQVHLEIEEELQLPLLQWSQQRSIRADQYARELVLTGGVLDRAMRSPVHTVWVPGNQGSRQVISAAA